MQSDWTRTLVDAAAFADEQTQLAHVWTFLGLTRDVAKEGEWFRASLATCSVFVQRMGGELKGFENLCAHRKYPLRHTDRGSGPIVCGYHHWRYDNDGRALGIPMCEEVFGCVSRALDARLNAIEVAVCGTLVFGRFPAPHASQSLREFLGEGFDILETMSQMKTAPLSFSRSVEANWRLCLHISLDDYHAVAVHPDSFGRDGYYRRANITYAKFGYAEFGPHNFLQNNADPDSFAKLVSACRTGDARANCYTILQVMPNLLLAHARTDGNQFYCALHHYIPIAHNRSLLRMWTYPTPFAIEETRLGQLYRRLSDPIRRHVVKYFTAHIMGQDIEVLERLQRVAPQIKKPPWFGALEERVAWFEASYRRLLGQPDAPPASGAGDKASSTPCDPGPPHRRALGQ